MITPIRALTIEQICERKDDLLVSSDDIKKVAKHVKEQAIEEFAERVKSFVDCGHLCSPTQLRWSDFNVVEMIDRIAKQMKGGAE